jgi:hypothetical protein
VSISRRFTELHTRIEVPEVRTRASQSDRKLILVRQEDYLLQSAHENRELRIAYQDTLYSENNHTEDYLIAYLVKCAWQDFLSCFACLLAHIQILTAESQIERRSKSRAGKKEKINNDSSSQVEAIMARIKAKENKRGYV